MSPDPNMEAFLCADCGTAFWREVGQRSRVLCFECCKDNELRQQLTALTAERDALQQQVKALQAELDVTGRPFWAAGMKMQTFTEKAMTEAIWREGERVFDETGEVQTALKAAIEMSHQLAGLSENRGNTNENAKCSSCERLRGELQIKDAAVEGAIRRAERAEARVNDFVEITRAKYCLLDEQ